MLHILQGVLRFQGIWGGRAGEFGGLRRFQWILEDFEGFDGFRGISGDFRRFQEPESNRKRKFVNRCDACIDDGSVTCKSDLLQTITIGWMRPSTVGIVRVERSYALIARSSDVRSDKLNTKSTEKKMLVLRFYQ